ncbi:MAG: HAD family hydrolase, partial [Bacillota bacterium]
LADMKEKFGEQLNISLSKSRFVEIMNPEVSKGQAVADLAQELGFQREEVVTIGDSYNDIEMLEYAGLGVAVENAWPAVQEAADYITEGHNENGVAKFIEEFIL